MQRFWWWEMLDFFFRRVFFLGSSRVAFEGTATSCTHQSPCRPTRCKTQHFDDEVVGPGYFGMIWIVLATRPLFLAYSKLLDHSQCFSFIGIVFANGWFSWGLEKTLIIGCFDLILYLYSWTFHVWGNLGRRWGSKASFGALDDVFWKIDPLQHLPRSSSCMRWASSCCANSVKSPADRSNKLLGAPSSVLAPSSKARSPSSVLAPSSKARSR